MKKYKILIILIMYIGILLIGTKVYAATGTAIEETTRIRKEANTKSKTVVLISVKEEVDVLGKEGDWYKVKYQSEGKSYTGYIREDLLKVKGEVEESTNSENKEDKKEETTNKNENNATSEENNAASQENNKENENTEKTESDKTQEVSTTVTEIKENDKIKINQKIIVKVLPLINSNNIGEIEKNSELTISEIIGNWYRVDSKEKSGWISKVNLENVVKQENETSENEDQKENNKDNNKTEQKEDKKETEAKKETKTLYVATETLNLREKPENSAKILKQLSMNNKVTILEEVDKTWSKVKISGTTGYVASKYLSEKKQEVTSRGSNETRTPEDKKEEEKETATNNTSSNKDVNNSTTTSNSSQNTSSKNENKESSSNASSNSSSTSNSSSKKEESNSSSNKTTGADIVAYAKKYLGCKYVLGGTSPSGFDCSGFTQYVYKHFGYSINRTSSAQRSNGVAVKKADLQQGDIVCFKGHVGIYIGGNKFIHASNPSDGVKITSLSDSYYVKTYITARRILK